MRYQIRLVRNTWRGVLDSGRGKVDMSRWPAVLSPDPFSRPEIYPDSETLDAESVWASGSGLIEVFPESDVLIGRYSKASSSVQTVSSSFIDLIIFSDDWIEDISISAMSSLAVSGTFLRARVHDMIFSGFSFFLSTMSKLQKPTKFCLKNESERNDYIAFGWFLRLLTKFYSKVKQSILVLMLAKFYSKVKQSILVLMLAVFSTSVKWQSYWEAWIFSRALRGGYP